jgi:2,3-bisphosphoglycerate-dependent phosphoglycerate mutase|tara:strand:- start:324 stop:998 length:675 start_codon:yes stop_codon:yes gene_type:complete
LGKLILVRHGKSLWNKENRFTGWIDIDLDIEGEKEAEDAGKQIKEKNIAIDLAYSSIFKRAYKTGKIILDVLDKENIEIKKDWRLNERHYGKLQGLNKSEIEKEYGTKQIFLWRRDYLTKPPQISRNDIETLVKKSIFKNIPKDKFPSGESLKDTLERVNEFHKENILKKIDENKNILITAHGNSLRALVKIIEKITDEDISKLEIPTGKPIFYDYVEGDFIKI